MPSVAIVAEEAAVRRELENSLGSEFNIVKASGYDDAYSLLVQGLLDVLVLDVDSGDHKLQAGRDLLKAVGASDIDSLVIVISDDQKTRTALRMVGAGAYDFLVKPVNPAVLKSGNRASGRKGSHRARKPLAAPGNHAQGASG